MAWTGALPSGGRGLATAFTLKFLEHRLRADKVAVEDFARHSEQLGDERVAQFVSDRGADFASIDDVAGAEYGKLLRHDGLPQIERLLQFLDAAVAGGQRLENPDADRMRERAEEIRFEHLKPRSTHAVGPSLAEYLNIAIFRCGELNPGGAR